MTAFARALDNQMEFFNNEWNCSSPQDSVDLCFHVINLMKEKEEVCEKTCEALYFIIYRLGDSCPDPEKLSGQLVKFYQTLGFACFLRPFQSLFEVVKEIQCDWIWFIKDCSCIFKTATEILSRQDSNDQPKHLQLVMKILQSLLAHLYDDVLDSGDIGRLIALASHGLLSQAEGTFEECHKVLVELCANLDLRLSLLFYGLLNSHGHRIIKDCVDVILAHKNISDIKACGHLLHIMNVQCGYDIATCWNIDKGFLKDILETYPEEIQSDESISDNLMKIINASSKEEAEGLAALINSNIYNA
ncbi:hypothetical protein RF11_10400 [Thelohanellus kitauei]|uniref:Uncharacterized protein n=1 Tax=Thelohanellus kitauei TaxID=669202 RepID=A0A0C2N5R7_THEKT|nr:hypothetical protein RF11_10400 [Thelohanellus kitauei]